MAAMLLDGKRLAEKLYQNMTLEIADLTHQFRAPGLAVIQVGSNLASQIYVSRKTSACKQVGIRTFDCHLPENTSKEQLIDTIEYYNELSEADGILLQLPLPNKLDPLLFTSLIAPKKDVDGLCPQNVGLLQLGVPRFIPCTPLGIMHMLRSYNIQAKGMHAVVIGRSSLVGKPMAACLLQAGATVTVCHSETKQLESYVRSADLLVAAIGKPLFVKGSWLKPGCVVVDVGISRLSDGTVVGDVDFKEAKEIAQAISPVPGGVGPLTVAMLLRNTLDAAQSAHKLACL